FSAANIPAEPDLLSIDIDGNDWHVWHAINAFRPRVVIVEYNSIFPPDTDIVVAHDNAFRWNGSSYFGASLKSLCVLAERKGYKVVACDFLGVNAFFVRNDLVTEAFQGPFTAEFHYEPPRYFLNRKVGHQRKYGQYTSAASVLGKD